MIEEYIAKICDILDIDIPQISFDASNFPTETTLALCDTKNYTICIRPENQGLDLFFSISHELRHLWQLEEDETYYFDSYISSDKTDVESYNLQVAEIDANAFASIMMTKFFHVKPLWSGMPSSVVDAINLRIKEIVNVYDS